MSESGNDGMPGNTLKYEKSMSRMFQRGSYAKMKSHERLSGGADDENKSSANVNKLSTDANANVTPMPSRTLRVGPDPEEVESMPTESSSNHVEETITGDKRVNEMIDYVIQNLQEAGKALASLGDNFEHDLKLMFVDVMGKVQNWVSLAQIRLDAAKADLDSLRKELISRSNELASRDREIADLKTKLTDCEVTRGAYEKALTENVQRSGGTIPNESTFTPSRQPMPTDAISLDPSGPTSHPVNAETIHSEGILSASSMRKETSPERTRADPGASRAVRGYSGDTPDDPRYGNTTTVDAAVQSGKSKEKSKRESELECELLRLRKENEKIMKERTDYENAIQRALLRGVSSLNAETLKVLRCPPVGCYTPCGPPPSPINTVETMVPCNSKKTRDNWTPRGCRTTMNASSRLSSSRGRPNVSALPDQGNNCCASKRPSTGNYGPSPRCKKSPATSDPSMVFLLHEADASSVCISGKAMQIRPCDRTKPRKLETSVCVKKLG